jgi:hypothetical protein
MAIPKNIVENMLHFNREDFYFVTTILTTELKEIACISRKKCRSKVILDLICKTDRDDDDYYIVNFERKNY